MEPIDTSQLERYIAKDEERQMAEAFGAEIVECCFSDHEAIDASANDDFAVVDDFGFEMDYYCDVIEVDAESLERANVVLKQKEMSKKWKDIFPTLVENYLIFRGENTLPTTETKPPSSTCELKCVTRLDTSLKVVKVNSFYFSSKIYS